MGKIIFSRYLCRSRWPYMSSTPFAQSLPSPLCLSTNTRGEKNVLRSSGKQRWVHVALRYFRLWSLGVGAVRDRRTDHHGQHAAYGRLPQHRVPGLQLRSTVGPDWRAFYFRGVPDRDGLDFWNNYKWGRTTIGHVWWYLHYDTVLCSSQLSRVFFLQRMSTTTACTFKYCFGFISFPPL